MTDKETEAHTGETITQGHLTNRGRSHDRCSQNSNLEMRVFVSSTASTGTVPVAKTTALPTCLMALGYKSHFLLWTLEPEHSIYS